MILEFFLSLLGSWGRAILEWIHAHPTFSIPVFGLWMAIFFAGKYQLRRVERRSENLSLEFAKSVLENNPNLTDVQLYDLLYPKWCEMLRETAWFIPHRHEIWPIPANPEKVRERINFTPDWLRMHLWKNGIEIQTAIPPSKST